MPKAIKFKIGDIVRRKSGGPKMTVFGNDSVGDQSRIVRKLFSGTKLQIGYFNDDILDPAENDEKK